MFFYYENENGPDFHQIWPILVFCFDWRLFAEIFINPVQSGERDLDVYLFLY